MTFNVRLNIIENTDRMDSMNTKDLIFKLRKAREDCGFSQQFVADSLKLPRTAITQIESGKRSISTLELSNLAKLYHSTISSFFDTSQNEDEEITAILFRAEPGLQQEPKIRQSVEKYIHLCHQGLLLENILEREPRLGPPVYNLPIPKTKSEAAKQGEKIAEQERNRLGIGHFPIADMMELINSQNIWVSGTLLPNNISGLFLNHPKTGLIILVNTAHVIARKRFSCAHEYAHALLDRQSVVRISTSNNHSELVEIRANAFASAFLMPANSIQEILQSLNKGQPSREKHVIFDVATDGKNDIESRTIHQYQKITYQDASLIAHHFGVSYQAAVYRLRSLGYFSQAECTFILNQENEGKKYLRMLHMFSDLEGQEERTRWDRELICQLVRLGIEAFRCGGISRGRLLELGKELDIDGNLLYDLAQSVMDDQTNQ